MPAREPPNVLIVGLLAARPPGIGVQVSDDCILIDATGQTGVAKQLFERGGKSKMAAPQAVIQRPHAHGIAGKQKSAAAGIPDGKGEVAEEMVDQAFAPAKIGRERVGGVRTKTGQALEAGKL
jgi:hypothetical protein